MRFIVGCVGLLFLVAAPAVDGQDLPAIPGSPVPAAGAPARPGAPAAGKAHIRGRVLRADTGGAAAGAEVALSGPVGRRTTADETGGYEFRDLPAGRFTLSATKPGYVTSSQYGPLAPSSALSFDPGRPFILTDDQIIEKLDISLPRGGVITGRITDEFGEPVAGVPFRAERYTWGPGGRQLGTFTTGMFINPGTMVTDDLGEYRIFGLPPGEYVVSARIDAAALTSGPGGDADAAAGFLPTYFPGTVKVEEARAIRVGAGQEVVASFAMTPGRMRRVSGIATNSSGAPAVGLNVFLAVETATTAGQRSGGPVAADGSFSIGNVPPGDYDLRVRAQGLGGPGTEVASMQISVGTEDLTGLQLTTRPGTDIKGRIEWEGSAPRPTEPLRASATSVEWSPGPLGRPSPLTYLDREAGTVQEDGTFVIGGIVGIVTLRVGGGSMQPWSVKSVLVGSTDITHVGADAASLGGDAVVRVIMSDKTSEIAGSVRDGRGQTVTHAIVVLLPQEPMAGLRGAQLTSRLWSDDSGSFRIGGRPAGRYVIAAMDALGAGEEWNPAVQARIRSEGRSITLGDGEKLAINLELLR